MASYHHGNLAEALLATAVELARAAGPDGVALREVARRTGVSHNAAYRHFADRDALLGAVAEVGMAEMEETMRKRLADVSETEPATAAFGRLRAIGHGYVEYALAEPGLFEVCFSGFEIRDDHRFVPPVDGPYAMLNDVLDECVASGAIPGSSRPGAEIACWAAVHGFAVLHQRGPLRGTPPADREALLDIMIDRLQRGMS